MEKTKFFIITEEDCNNQIKILNDFIENLEKDSNVEYDYVTQTILDGKGELIVVNIYQRIEAEE